MRKRVFLVSSLTFKNEKGNEEHCERSGFYNLPEELIEGLVESGRAFNATDDNRLITWAPGDESPTLHGHNALDPGFPPLFATKALADASLPKAPEPEPEAEEDLSEDIPPVVTGADDFYEDDSPEDEYDATDEDD